MMKDEPVVRAATRLTVGSTLAYFRAVIQSGQSWTENCQKAYDDAQEDLRRSSSAFFAAMEGEKRLRDALAFYADPDTYFAWGHFSDPPCGDWGDDFEDLGHDGYKPGKRARTALASEQQEEKP